MNLRRVALIVAVCAIATTAMYAAWPMGDQDFTLVNKTGLTIDELYVSPHSAENWGKDILGEGYLDNNRQRKIIFKPGTKAARWDIKLIDENGKEHKRFDLNLLEIQTITVTRKADDSWYWTWK